MASATIDDRASDTRTVCAAEGCSRLAAPTADARGIPARYCSERCRSRANRRTPAQVARQSRRFERWYAQNASWQAWRSILRRTGQATPERLAALETLRGRGHVAPAEVRQLLGLPPGRASAAAGAVWTVPAPTAQGTYAPGTAPCSLHLSPHHTIVHAALPALHGLLTQVHGGRHGQAPAWSLVPWRAGCGWAVVWRDDRGAAHAGTDLRAVRIGCDRHDVIVGCAGHIRWPDPQRWARPRGRQRITIDTLTPVVIRSGVGRVRRQARREGRAPGVAGTITRTAPRAEHILSALVQLATWAGVEVPRDRLRLEVIAAQTEPSTVAHGGKLGGDGRIRGWSGRVEVVCNAPARWLLELAAAGWGLGGRTAYGYGAIRLRAAEAT